jgi:hypothetical protein
MQPSSNDQPVPRETSAGLQRGSTPPTSGTPVKAANPAPGTRAMDPSGKHVTADKWNQ